MKEFAIRLKENEDITSTIEKICKDNNFNTVVVLSSVGSIKHLNIRLAMAKEFMNIEKDFEILSLNGTVSKGKSHLHICVSDDKGVCVGGHLVSGTIVNTTCELVLGVLEEYESERIFDNNTNFNEIHFLKK